MVLQWLDNKQRHQIEIKHIFFNDIIINMKCGDILTKTQLRKKMNISTHQIEWLMVFLQKEQYKYSNYKIEYKSTPKIHMKILRKC